MVCAYDGDVDCGQLTTALRATGAEVTSSDFRWEGGLRDPEPVEH